MLALITSLADVDVLVESLNDIDTLIEPDVLHLLSLMLNH